MIGSRSWRALMRRNFIYRKRNIIGSLFEFFLPIIFVGLLVAIKRDVQNSKNFAPQIVPAYIPDEFDAFVTMSFSDYVIALQARRFCYDAGLDFNGNQMFGITGIPYMSYNWQVPFIKCDYRNCQSQGEDASQKYCQYNILALAPSTETDVGGLQRARDFESYLLNRYPVLNTSVAAGLNSTMLPFPYPFVQLFKSAADMEGYVKWGGYGNIENPKIAMGVVFNGNAANNYDYVLRLNSTNDYPGEVAQPGASTTPDPSRLFSSFSHDDTACKPTGGKAFPNLGPNPTSCTHQYVYNGALVVQRLVNDFILADSGAKARGNFVAEHGVSFVPFPSPAYIKNGFYGQIAPYAPLLVMLGLLYPVAAFLRAMVWEKELRQKELMKMMSVTESDIQWSWFASYFLFHFFTATFASAFTSNLYSNSDGGYLWSFWILTFLAIICFAMALSTITNKSTRATLFGLLLFFIGYFLTLTVKYDTGSLALISLISLHPVGAFTYGLQQIGDWEDKGVGVISTTFSSTDNPSTYSFRTCLGSLLFDSIFWGLVSWYMNRVLPNDYGQPLPWYFPFTSAYWYPNTVKVILPSGDNGQDVYDESVPMEPVTETLRSQAREGTNVEIRGLTKHFGNKTAVNCLNLSMYNGQITGLLGHNGAGKTTTISMLTGMITPTEGCATLSGKNIRSQMPQIRQEIGVCLQHDCLFPQLTVKEHVQFFARIKGLYARMSHSEAEEKISSSIQDVALGEKSNCLSKDLSGGMQRKLSVAIAFCGDSKTVLLDEPTSGMDPFSRRFTWNVIRRYRAGRTIILTTHFMDEADLLCDRIAIMAEGRLRCVGSSLFLKKTFGVGYQLTIEKAFQGSMQQDNGSGLVNEDRLATEGVDNKLRSIVTNAVREAHLLTDVGTELSFQLPLGASPRFKPMFDALEKEVEKGTIETYGVSITTLEEVFLLVARGVGATRQESSQGLSGVVAKDARLHAKTAFPKANIRSKMDLGTNRLFLNHLRALFKKRAINFKRDMKAWCCTTVLPISFVLIGFIIFAYASPNRDLTAIKLDLNDYNIAVKAEHRNPTPVNANDSLFTCQPGSCTFQATDTAFSGESYAFCGAQAKLSGFCSVSIPTALQDKLLMGGVLPIPENGTDIKSYASVYFTHDLASVTSDGQKYSEAVVQQCLKNKVQYLSGSECEHYGGIGYVIGYNFTALHVTPLYQSLVDAAIAKEALNDNEFTITTTIHPLPITQTERKAGHGQDAFVAWFLLVLSFPFIAGTFATFVVIERESKAKHLQTVAGVNPVAYWLSTYLWDIMNYQIPLWATVIMMFAFNVTALTTTTNDVVIGVVVALIFYGPASAGFSYCVSFMFKSPSMCNMFIIIFCFLIGMGGPLAQFILRMLGSDPSQPRLHLVHMADTIEWILRFIPSFCLGNSIFKSINIRTYEFLAGGQITVWDRSLLRYEVVFLLWQSVGYLMLAIALDVFSNNPRAVGLWRKLKGIITCRCWCSRRVGPGFDAVSSLAEDDDDVVREQERVLCGSANDDLIILSQLTKVYDTGKVAVNNMSLAIPPGQCFGLLGINGAGKTTTMSMLTAEFPPTSGDATLAGYSVRNEPGKTRRRIGYCPQFDAHFQNLTGREHVELYASVKGIPDEYVREAAASKLDEVGISEADRDRLSAGYSGGMKRRLSLACATIGQPQILFLDECSTGVDPVARREIWQMISTMVAGKDLPERERPSVILTTHSMEECEALCPRIGIMASGKLCCLGSAQHLKSKFGQGYQVELKVKTVDPDDDDFQYVLAQLYRVIRQADDEEANCHTDDVLYLAQTALQSLTGDDYLTTVLAAANNEVLKGQLVLKTNGNGKLSIDFSIDELASFATMELRIRNLNEYVSETYLNSTLLERQDNKVRYEVDNSIISHRIANIFASIEENKERLMISDYGVSQTSLEQVFNMKVAEAEKHRSCLNGQQQESVSSRIIL